jgi:hypothetical protein
MAETNQGWEMLQGRKITPYRSTIQLVKLDDRRLTVREVAAEARSSKFPAEEEVEIVQFDFGAMLRMGWLVRRDNGDFMFVEEFEDGMTAAKWTYYGQAFKNEDNG